MPIVELETKDMVEKGNVPWSEEGDRRKEEN